jgi:hypothetical protein
MASVALAEDPVAPTAEELEQRRIELEALQKRLETERARFEADKARFDAERALVESPAVPHDPFAGRLRMARKPVRLTRKGLPAGDLPALTVVVAVPSETPGQLVVQHEGENFEAPETSFAPEEELLGEARHAEATALRDLEAREAEAQALRIRCARQEEQVLQLEAQLRRVVPGSHSASAIRTTNTEGRVVMMSESGGRAALNDRRRDWRQCARQLELAEQDLLLLREHWERSRQVRERLERAFLQFRNERTP